MKSKVVALILSIFLGELGIDRFYLGYIGTGAASFGDKESRTGKKMSGYILQEEFLQEHGNNMA